MGDTGLEPESLTNGKTKHLRNSEKSRAAECAALSDKREIDAKEGHIIVLWPTLPEGVRQRILGLVEGATVTNGQ